MSRTAQLRDLQQMRDSLTVFECCEAFDDSLPAETQAELTECFYQFGDPESWLDFSEWSSELQTVVKRFYAHMSKQLDPRRAWENGLTRDYCKANHWPTLDLVDFIRDQWHTFADIGGPTKAHGFHALSPEVRATVLDLWALYPAARPHRVTTFVRVCAHWHSQTLMPIWSVRYHIRRAKMRRSWPGLLAKFAHRGDPLYTSHRSYRNANWPECDTWTKDERDYLSHRFFTWDSLPSLNGIHRGRHQVTEHLWNTGPHGA